MMKEQLLKLCKKTQLFFLTFFIIAFVVWGHTSANFKVKKSVDDEQQHWQQFIAQYPVQEFGEDGYFVRAIRNGFKLFHYTDKYAFRFTSNQLPENRNSCADCHTLSDLAYGFVQSDRFKPDFKKRVSFEEQLMRCYVSKDRLAGFTPTIFDPAIRDLRILARLVAYKNQLSEGYQRNAETTNQRVVKL